MRFDADQAGPGIVYKLLTATITPRPIAWVVTQDAGGVVNAAPYSFFNAMGANPPTVAIGMQADPERGFKDSARNILATGQFVVNLVPEQLADAMNLTAVDAPVGVDELQLAGLTPVPSDHVAPPRIAESPVALECENLSSVVTGPHQTVVIGRVLAIHIDDAFVLDADRGHVDGAALNLIGRAHGPSYIRTGDRFDMTRPDWKSWSAENSKPG